MESSATSLNIQGPSPDLDPALLPEPKDRWFGHNHKYPNFGRYVADCPACIAKYPDGKPKKSAKAQDDKDAEIARLKAELAQSYTQTVKPDATDINKQLAELMLRRESKQLLKEEELEKRKDEARADFLRVAKEQEAQKKAREAQCESTGHRKENGRSAIAGSQVHNDGKMHPFCMRCFKTFPARYPNHEEMPTAV